MKDDSPWPTISNFACGLILAALAVMGLMMALSGCAAAPRVVVVPHVCVPEGDSLAYQKCRADCPDGDAFVVENARDTMCACRKPRDPM